VRAFIGMNVRSCTGSHKKNIPKVSAIFMKLLYRTEVVWYIDIV